MSKELTNKLDLAIKHRLENIQVKFSDKSWQAMESKMMEHNLLSVDQAEESFGVSSTPAQLSDWDQFAPKLNAAEHAQFDQHVRTKIDQAPASYKVDWPEFETKLRERDRRDKVIFFWMSRAAAVLLLLTIGFSSFLKYEYRLDLNKWATNYLNTQSTSHKKSSIPSNINVADLQSVQEASANPNENTTTLAASTLLSAASPSVWAESIQAIAPLTTSPERADYLGTIDFSAPILLKPVRLLLNTTIGKEPKDTKNEIHNAIAAEADIALLPTNIYLPENEVHLSFLAPLDYSENKLKTSLKAHAGSESNVVNSPNGPRDIGVVNTSALGVGVAIQKDDVGVNIGANYHNLEYLDYRTNENADVDFLNIPVEVSYQAYADEKTSLYAIAGVEGHFTLTSDYNLLSEVSRAQSIPVQDGLIRNGGLNNNMFTSANLGLGVTRQVSNNTALFGEIRYKSPISRVNLAAGDDIRFGIGVNAGAKFSL